MRKNHLLIISAIVFISMMSIVVIIDQNNREKLMENSRKQVNEQLETLRVLLEKEVASKVLLTQGLIAYVGINPELSHDEFDEYAKELYRNNRKGIISFQLSKNNVVSHIYPLEGHESALGLDHFSIPGEKEAITRAIQQNRMVVAGPIELIEGGTAFISRGPVFIASHRQTKGQKRYWGLAQVLIDAEDLYEQIALFSKSTGLRIVLFGKDGLGRHGGYFFGDQGVMDQDPIELSISIPNGSWHLAAIPENGWVVPTSLSYKMVGVLLALVAALLVWVLLYTPIKLRRMVAAATESLQEQQEIWSLAIAGSDDGIWEWRLKSGQAFYSERWKTMLGYSEETEFESIDAFYRVVHPDDFKRVQEAIEGHLNGDSLQYRCEMRLRCKNGEYLWIRARGKALFNDKGIATRMLGSHTDITHERAQQTLLIQQSKMAAMGEMIGAIAHQWRQPLSILSIYAHEPLELLEEGSITHEELEAVYLRSIEQIRQMNRTIDDFKDFFNPEKQKSTFVISEIIMDVERLLHAELRKYDIHYEYHLSDRGTTLYGVPNELKQVILNLVKNAIDAIKERANSQESPTGWVRLFCEETSHQTTIRISDSGGGIPKEVMGHIFTPYFTTKGASDGTGIGLYLAKTIIESSFGGSLSVDNLEAGAEFTLTLPHEVLT